ncbi:MAG: Transglycosylase, Slt family [uncultured Sulfurovum sp.]|uniref:Transglycosylase, Slt family n=1 Tax=uncultured Sulfurovum sp. TaxID=269237 RepID=A0A6S6TW04_9BACT|nr:MAG: Transglycosylase, Slt family [uncultured Sulfurovum sp.]
MKSFTFKILIPVAFILGYLIQLAYCQQDKCDDKNIITSKPATLLDKIKEKKRLDVVILDAPVVYYVGSDDHQGFEYDLLKHYAKSMNLELNLTIVPTIQKALELTRRGVGDLTAASLSINQERLDEFKFGPYFNSVQEELICHNGLHKRGLMPTEINHLNVLNIAVGENTSASKTLEKIQAEVDGFDFNMTKNLSTQDLLKKVWKKEIDCTVTDTHIFSLSQRYYPELVSTITLTPKLHLGWILRQGDDSLNESLFRWLNKYERSGKMAELHNFYYGFLKIFDYYDTKVFSKRLKKRFPKYEKIFKKAGEKYNIPWIILAAQSYQESHWNPAAKSYTGVRGMMMLTNNTAKLLKVKNRLSVSQSIYGGAKYFDMMRKKFPENLEGKNLWAFTLAAYNVGLGHVYDAQKLAKKLNKNPNSWNDLKTVLPLLSQKKYYKDLKHGRARGNEPVHYVDAIQHYYDIMVKYELEKMAKNSNGSKT